MNTNAGPSARPVGGVVPRGTLKDANYEIVHCSVAGRWQRSFADAPPFTSPSLRCSSFPFASVGALGGEYSGSSNTVGAIANS